MSQRDIRQILSVVKMSFCRDVRTLRSQTSVTASVSDGKVCPLKVVATNRAAAMPILNTLEFS